MTKLLGQRIVRKLRINLAKNGKEGLEIRPDQAEDLIAYFDQLQNATAYRSFNDGFEQAKLEFNL